MNDRQPAPTFHVCPYLGLIQDRDSRYGFPTDGNFCHREGAPRAIQLDYQEDICLGGRYQQCPIYLQLGPAAPAPAPASAAAPRRTARRFWLIGLLLLLIALCGFFFAVQSLIDGFGIRLPENPTGTPAEDLPEPLLLPSLTPLPQLEATLLPTGLPAPTSAATATETPSETPTATETASQPPTATATAVPPTDTPAPTETPSEPPPSPTPEAQKPTDTPEP